MVGLGEVLWDIFPSGRLLGGAPANFTYMANVLGNCGIVASRVGNDALGNEACVAMSSLGLDDSYVQRDPEHETGTAGVVIDSDGQPTFSIKESVAWDFLEWTQKWIELSRRADVVCFGSLAQRSSVSAATIEQFVRNTRPSTLRICDVNLRRPFYGREALRNSFRHAHIAKLNDQELLEVASLFGFGLGDEEVQARRLMDCFGLRLVCVTRGANGSLLVSQEQTVVHRGLRVKVTDAVGAGDAFTACLAHYYVRGKSLEEISESANRLASWIATQEGAMPRIQKARLQEILNEVVLE
ncbi:MAG TPA: PfkB family carbohydrate kinase [Tepidisphaeraceae bacterium]|nr:PfkB family carbohydrate kinase [Tepidisphaeraceae bacterium]